MALGLGLGIVILVIVRWARHPAAKLAAPGVSAERLAQARARADHETEE
jgi:hypothetical protein